MAARSDFLYLLLCRLLQPILRSEMIIKPCRRIVPLFCMCLSQKNHGFDMPWDNSVNKNAVIYAAHTTLGVRNMPLPG